VAVVGTARDAVSAAPLLAQFPELQELGRIRVQDETAAGNATEIFTVPTGKYWRLLALVHVLVTDDTVDDRIVSVTTRTAADATIEAISHEIVAASTSAQRTTIFGTAAHAAGNRAVAAAGTITIAEPVTDGDTFTIGDITYTLVDDDDGTVTNAIPTGGTEAATKTAIATAVAKHPLVTCPAAFTSDDLIVTAREAGVAGDSIVFVEGVLTHANNILDGSGTLGGDTSGVDPGDKVSELDFPTAGALLGPGEDIIVAVADGAAGDTITTFLVALEFDNSPV
jgi:hypothetical protein